MKESGFKDIRENAPRELRRTYIAEQRAAAVAEERARLRQELELIRTQGFCITVSEQDEGVASVSAPIRGSDGIARYSLAVVGAEKRIREKNIDQIRDEVVRTAQQLEREYQLIHMS